MIEEDFKDILLTSYDTERLKTLTVWSTFSDDDLPFRPAPRTRTPLEHMVHQCVSENTWMKNMFDVQIARPALPESETRIAFLHHYADVSEARRNLLATRDNSWWAAETTFFGESRSRAWVFIRRIAHSAHHRGQLTVYLRLLGRPVYSTYGPTADTGGLFLQHAPTLYRYASVEALLAAEDSGGQWPDLPGPGPAPPTERP